MPKGYYERTDAVKEKMSVSHKGKKFTDEHRQHLKDVKKELWKDPIFRAKQLAILHSPEVLARRLATLKVTIKAKRERRELNNGQGTTGSTV
jgi:hypothetical protein